MHIPEADLEYLIRTLSEARSRASELAVSLGSRLGTDHRLTELANAAATHIESTLREVRNSAAEGTTASTSLAGLQGALQSTAEEIAPSHAAPSSSPNTIGFAASAGVDREHWLSQFVDELLTVARTTGRITFESTERLLQQRKDEFLHDFLTARRMYRAYPQLFPELTDQDRQMNTP